MKSWENGIRATIIVVGDGNSAGQAAVVLSEMASHVHVIMRGGSLGATMSRYLISRIELSAHIPRYTNLEIVFSTLGFADLSGDKQYITTGNLASKDRVCVFFMDYVARQRLKVLVHGRTVEGTSDAEQLIRQLRTSEFGARVERVIVIHVDAFDWNCPQHITQRFTPEELQEIDDEDLDQLKEITS